MTIRKTYLFSFLSILGLISFSLYLQFYDGVIPCPLCSLQRLAFITLGVVFLMGIILAPIYVARLFIHVISIVVAGTGIFLAGRQIWLQHFPSVAGNECGVSMQYMLEVLPFNEAMTKILAGSAECTQRGWEFLSLNMAEWSLVCFIVFLIVGLAQLIKEFR